MMREEGGKNHSPSIELATMTGPKSCKKGDTLPLDENDLLFFEHLLSPSATNVSVNTSHKDNSSYLSALQGGDTVALIRINEEKYLVLGKVVGL